MCLGEESSCWCLLIYCARRTSGYEVTIRRCIVLASASGLQGSETNVAAVLHAVKMDALDHLVGLLLCQADTISQRGHAQNTSARCNQHVTLQRSAGVEHGAIVGLRGNAGNGVALAWA